MKKEDRIMLEKLKELTGRLAPFEKYLSMSVHNYLRITPQDTVKLFGAAHGPEWKTKLKPSVMTCGTCKLSAVKSIAVEYYAAVKSIADIEVKEEEKKNKAKENATK